MFNRARMRFLRGLAAAAIPPVLDNLMWTPLAVAMLLALDMLARDVADERAAA